MFTAIIPILCNINPCMFFLLSIEKKNTSEGIRLQITKEAGSAGKLSCYLYIFQDTQINISDAQFLNVVY